MGRAVTYDEQLTLWVAGESVHGDQCVPDFSCCEPDLKADAIVRKAFQEGSVHERITLLGTFLSAAFDKMSRDGGPTVKVAGFGEEPS